MSYQERSYKPEEEIYRAAERIAGLAGQQLCFIDDKVRDPESGGGKSRLACSMHCCPGSWVWAPPGHCQKVIPNPWDGSTHRNVCPFLCFVQAENVEGARALGWSVIHHRHVGDSLEKLAQLGLPVVDHP